MIYDSHCHLSTRVTHSLYEGTRNSLIEREFPVNLMMTNHIDEELILMLLNDKEVLGNRNIMLNVGIHPWFTHLYTTLTQVDTETDDEFKRRHYSIVLEKHNKRLEDNDDFDRLVDILPSPLRLSDKLELYGSLLEKYPNLHVGEIGLDKLARIPNTGYLNDKASSGLSNYKVCMSHQLDMFISFLKLSKVYSRRCSVHCVNAHGLMYDTMCDVGGLTVVMHSYSGSLDTAKRLVQLQKVGVDVWFGASEFVNLKGEVNEKVKLLISAFPSRVLMETDYGVDMMSCTVHEKNLNEVLRKLSVSGMKEGMLWDNWIRFVDDPVNNDIRLNL